MTDRVRVRVEWLPASEGGRIHPPTRTPYSTVVRFPATPDSEVGSWSIVLDIDEAYLGRNVMEGTLRFLVPEGPTRLLYPANRFELLEGRTVAQGVILDT